MPVTPRELFRIVYHMNSVISFLGSTVCICSKEHAILCGMFYVLNNELILTYTIHIYRQGKFAVFLKTSI